MASLAVLRQAVGDRLGLRIPGTVTAVSVKGLVSIVDGNNTEPDDSLRGSWVIFTSGTQNGNSRQVAGNRSGELIFRSALTGSAPSVNDTFDLYRRFTPAQVKVAINYGIQQSFPQIYVMAETEVAESATTLEYAYPAGMQEVRQLRRRSNPGQTPATYVELPGGLWEDLGSAIRIRYRPSTGQYLQFVGISEAPALSLEADVTPVDTEIVVCGAAMTLYGMVAEGEGASNIDYTRQAMADWGKRYDAAKKQLAMPSIPYEIHPPYVRVVTAPQTLVGPINP